MVNERTIDTAPDDMGEAAPLESAGDPDEGAEAEQAVEAGRVDERTIDTAPDDMGEAAPLVSTGDPEQVEAVAPDERTMLLGLEEFSQSIYERGFRQGYLRGIVDGRQRFLSELEQGRATTGGGRPLGAAPESAPSQQGGAIIVLPPGVSPEMLLDSLRRLGRN